jgi:hypothetical protein
MGQILVRLHAAYRSVIKVYLRWSTGQCELERICRRKGFHTRQMSLEFASCLYRSKQILSWRQVIFFYKPFDVENCLKTIASIKKIKGLDDAVSTGAGSTSTSGSTLLRANMQHSLHALRYTNTVISHIDKIRRTKFNASDSMHANLFQ